MSIIPLILRDWWDDGDNYLIFPPQQSFLFKPNRSNRLLEPRLDLWNLTTPQLQPRTRCESTRPWGNNQFQYKNIESKINIDKDQFQAILDVQQFLPNEIFVKISDDNKYMVVEGKHNEKQDEHGFISRQFIRKYKLPDNINLKEIKSKLSSDGILNVTAPLLEDKEIKERVLPIEQVGPARLENKNKEKAEDEKSKDEETKDEKTKDEKTKDEKDTEK